MSFKSKNLQYSSAEPAFLRRMRGEINSQPAGKDRHATPIAFARKPKDPADDDAPTYVLEGSGNTLTKAEYDALVAGGDSGEGDESVIEAARGADGLEASNEELEKAKEVVGPMKKRKIARAVGDDEDEKHGPESQPTEKGNLKPVAKKAKKKKSKPIKLSFGEGENGAE